MLKNETKEKYKIAICDDDEIMCGCIKKIVEAYFEKQETFIDISMFQNGKELLQSEEEYQLIFLDIEMPEMDGLTAARYIYEKNKKMKEHETKITFLTSHEEVVRKAFQVQAFRFLLKDNYEEEIEECLDSFCIEMKENVILEIEGAGGKINIRERDILFIKSAHNGSEVWTEQDVLKCNKSLEKWMDILNEGAFLRTHRNNIVNLGKIDYIEDYIYTYTGEKVEYSKRKRKELEQKYLQYVYDHAK